MGDKSVIESETEGEALRVFTNKVLRDLRALEMLLAAGAFETGIRRIGAEQECFLVDRTWHPAPAAVELIALLKDPRYVTEVAKFNLEMNLDPHEFTGSCLRVMEAQLVELLAKARAAARSIGNEIVLIGILPTIRKGDLGLENMTPIPRYFALNRAMTKLRGSDYEIRLKGIDELSVKHESVMLESCNSSFQVHFQVTPDEFAKYYNIAQVLAAPTLAIATNSLLLFGRRLWHETRIALFQQSVDTRASSHHMREVSPRVDFGRQWVRSSVVELFQEAIARYRVLIAGETDEDPVAKVEQGIAPNLRALRLHNGTIYRWNRACYGISDNGKPHLRIENRILPSGPTPIDEMANAALWYGLMLGLGNEVDDITKLISFDDAKGNFFGAARQGLGAQITWIDGHAYQARDLLREKLLPLAWDGLRSAKIDTADIEKYLTIIQHRVETAQTGSRWALKSFAALAVHGTPGERLNAITAGAVAREQKNIPVSRWELAKIDEGGGWKNNYTKVEQFMSTDFVTVHPTDGLDFVANLMVWERIRHVCVEDAEHRLVGLVSYRALLRMLALGASSGKAVNETPVSEVMKLHPVCVTPETPTLRAIEMMARCDYGVLPVLNDGRLVGMIMARNFMHIAAELLAQKLSE